MAEARVHSLAAERATMSLWQSSFDSLRDGVCVVSPQGRIVEANRALAALFATTIEQLRGRVLADRFHDALGIEAPVILDPTRACDPHETAELDIAGRVLRLSRDPIRDASMVVIGAIHVIADVTDERRGESAVRFLADATAVLSSSLAWSEIVATTVRLAIPMLADSALLDVVRADGSLERTAVASTRPDLQPVPGDIQLSIPAAEEAMRTGKAVAFTERDSFRAGLSIPLVNRGRTLAVLTLGAANVRRFGTLDPWLAEGFARAAAAALGNAATHEAVREAERRAAEARATLDLIMQNAPLGIGVFDDQRRFVRVNAALERIHGIAADVHVGKRLTELLPQIDATVETDLQWVLDRREPLTRDVSGHTPSTGDALRHWLVSYYPLARADGELFGAGAIVADVTERRRAEDQLRNLAEVSRVLASSLDYETTLANVARMIVPGLADWCSIDMLEEGQLRRIAVAHVDPAKVGLAEDFGREFAPSLTDATGIGRVLRTGQSEWQREIPKELVEQTPDPRLRGFLRGLGLVSYMIVPIQAKNQPIGAITLCTAESGRRYDEADLGFAQELALRAGLAVENARLYGEAQQAVRAREDVLAFVSHDLKNPLTSVVMNATLLERATPEGPAGDRLRRHTRMIVRAADRMNRLVHDLLDWASLRAGHLALTVTEVPLAPLLNEITTLLQPVAVGRQQTLTVNVEEELTLRADRDRLLRVLSNLIGNALKYTREGGAITVVAKRERNDALIAVSDTGPGIPNDELPHVFDRYFRAKQAGAEGTGLGLAIAKGIVEAHGGRIWAESMVGVGSTFAFTIPTV